MRDQPAVSAPATGADPSTEDADSPSTTGPLGMAGAACGVLVAVPALVILLVISVYAIQRATPEDWPKVTTRDAARKLTGASLEAVRGMRLGWERPGGWGSEYGRSWAPGGATDGSFSSSYCYPDGLESIADEPAPGAYQLTHSWEGGPVHADQATSALQRLHSHLRKQGWDTGGSQRVPAGRELRAERDGYSLTVTWDAEAEELRGRTLAPCAYDPDWSPGDAEPPEPGSS